MNKLLCFIGIHKWSEWLNTEFAEWIYRYCSRCGKNQRVKVF